MIPDVFGSTDADNGGIRKQTRFLFGYRKKAEMRKLGWGLIAVFGAGIAAIPLIVVAIGIRLVKTHPVVRHDRGHS